jgi:hypothetical protein
MTGGISGQALSISGSYPCNCMGPQNGQPKCPCQMRNVIQRDGRWIERERDLGPVSPAPRVNVPLGAQGCICPPGAERTCAGGMCPRKPLGSIGPTS